MNTDPILYYSERASEYERIYQKPERQDDLQQLKIILKQIFSGKTVFEIACGTGYWTQVISETARSVCATDINEAVIDMALSKPYQAPVRFEKADMYNLPPHNEKFDAGFGGFIWSHIPKQELSAFLGGLVSHIASGGRVTFIDNQYVEGSNTPIDSQDSHGNTYQIRKLSDGSHHKVMKNFPGDAEIISSLGSAGSEIEIQRLRYFWLVQFKCKSNDARK